MFTAQSPARSRSKAALVARTAIHCGALVLFGLAAATRANAIPPAPAPETTPAYMFLDLPAAGERAAIEIGVISFTYDAEAGVPIRRHDPATSDDANVRVTMVVAKTDAPIPIVAKTVYATLVIVETDASKAPVKRLTFHDVKVETVAADGDEPSTRIVFVARSVSNH